MLRRLVLISCLLMTACHRPPAADTMPPTSAYIHFSDRFADRMNLLGMPWDQPCTKKEVSGPVAAISSVPAEQCYKMSAPEHLRGLWFLGTDGNWLCAISERRCSSARAPYIAQIEAEVPQISSTWCPGDLYAIDFVGRRTQYAHDLRRKAIVTVNRIISIKQIEAAGCTRNDGTLK